MNKAKAKETAVKIAKFVDERKATDILILDMEGISDVADYCVIAGANNPNLVKAVADNVEKKMHQEGKPCEHKEGYSEGHWILMDFGDVLLHVFLESERDLYNLEQLWGDAPSVDFAGEE